MKKCRYWMHGFGGDDPKTTAQAMKDAGLDIVVAGGDAVIEAVNAAGMSSWLCGGAFGLGGHKDDAYKAVDILGEPQVWFGAGCPNNPEIREGNLKSYEKMAATAGIKGILVDGCRFASPASGLGPFLTCFCDTCRDKAARLGFDFDAMRRDVKALHGALSGTGNRERGASWLETPVGALEWLSAHPGIPEWLRFRQTCTTEHLRGIGEILHKAGLRMGIYIFTPSVAPLVGQSYVELREFVDVFAPMIYRNYPDRPGIACLNWEVTIIPEELGLAGSPDEAKAMDLILSWMGLETAVPNRTIKENQAALPPEAVGHQTGLARSLLQPDKELAPIIYIDDPLMKQTAELVRNNGADGVNFFVYKDNWRELVKPGIVA